MMPIHIGLKIFHQLPIWHPSSPPFILIHTFTSISFLRRYGSGIEKCVESNYFILIHFNYRIVANQLYFLILRMKYLGLWTGFWKVTNWILINFSQSTNVC